MKEQTLALALGALMIAPIGAFAVAHAAKYSAPSHRLVGVGCGPDRVTMTAVNEDEFPAPCYAIGTPRDMGCISNDTPAQCAAYLGEGY